MGDPFEGNDDRGCGERPWNCLPRNHEEPPTQVYHSGSPKCGRRGHRGEYFGTYRRNTRSAEIDLRLRQFETAKLRSKRTISSSQRYGHILAWVYPQLAEPKGD